MKSIMQDDDRCYVCGRRAGLEIHHVLGGVANRKLSEKYGLKVKLCKGCHTGKGGAQYEFELNQRLKREAQEAFEKIHSHDEWMQVFRKNYL